MLLFKIDTAKKKILFNMRSVKTTKTTTKTKENFSINFSASYRREMKLTPFKMNYCLLQLDALKFFLGVHLHQVSLANFNFFQGKSKI